MINDPILEKRATLGVNDAIAVARRLLGDFTVKNRFSKDNEHVDQWHFGRCELAIMLSEIYGVQVPPKQFLKEKKDAR